jgi:hypothetical protein
MAIKTIAYVPLDDRPVNVYNVVQQAKSAGINVIMPNRSDYETDLGNGATGHKYGNPSAIVNWLDSTAVNSADAFIISADMIASGGLVGSRALEQPISEAQAKINLDVIKRLKGRFPTKPIYVFDTVMRLATTSGVAGLDLDVYDDSRHYGMIKRKYNLSSMEGIIASYDYDAQGNQISSGSGTSRTYGSLDVDKYLTAKARKFRLNVHIIEELAGNGYIDFLSIGIDDSYADSIQTYEIKWLEARFQWVLNGGVSKSYRQNIMPDADALGMALLGRLVKEDLTSSSLRVGYRFYGNVDGASAADEVDYHDGMTRRENVERHILLSGGTIDNTNYDVEILLVSEDTGYADQHAAINRMVSNEQNGKRSILVDNMTDDGNYDLMDKLLANGNKMRFVSYSSWNTFGNKVGIAIGAGVSRTAYLKYNNQTATERNNAAVAQGNLLYKFILKDYIYKRIVRPKVHKYIADYHTTAADASQNFAKYLDSSDIADINNQGHYYMILQEDGGFFASFDGNLVVSSTNSSGTPSTLVRVTGKGTTDFGFPWNRTFEADVEPNLYLS